LLRGLGVNVTVNIINFLEKSKGNDKKIWKLVNLAKIEPPVEGW